MLFSCAKSFEKRKQPTPNMVTILAATSTVGRKGLKPLMKDQVKRVGGEAIGQEGDGRPPIKDKGKNKVEEVPKKKHRFFAIGERGHDHVTTSLRSPHQGKADGDLYCCN